MAKRISLMYKAPRGFFKKPKKIKMNPLVKDISGITRAGVGIGIGTGIVSGAESAAGVSSGVTPALGTAGSMLGIVGVTTLGGHAVRNLRRLNNGKRKRRIGPEQYGYD